MIKEVSTKMRTTLDEMNLKRIFMFRDTFWHTEIVSLARPKSISVKLNIRCEKGALGKNLLHLQWNDIVNEPTLAWMHLLPMENRDVPYAEKLRRIKAWSLGIETYNSLMIDTGNVWLTEELVEKMLEKFYLPKPQTIIINTETRGLTKLLESFNMLQDNKRRNSFLVNWEKLLELAQTGMLVKRWEKLKAENFPNGLRNARRVFQPLSV